MPFELPELPYAENALAPHISSDTMAVHHGKHHRSYVEKLNDAIADSDLERVSLEEIIQKTANVEDLQHIFNSAAQAWNHAFFWNCMSPAGGGQPSSAVEAFLTDGFGSVDAFKKEFAEAAGGQFGSGWAWLYISNGGPKISAMPNAETPLMHGLTPLLTCDVWEHAYYLDYQNRRGDFVDVFLNKLINWDHVDRILSEQDN